MHYSVSQYFLTSYTLTVALKPKVPTEDLLMKSLKSGHK